MLRGGGIINAIRVSLPLERVPRVSRITAALLILIVSTPSSALAGGAPVDFARDVKPVLSDNCFRCHGNDAGSRQADLRLDILDPKLGPFAPRDGYAIVTPGKPDDSVLVMRITSDDDEVRMPP